MKLAAQAARKIAQALRSATEEFDIVVETLMRKPAVDDLEDQVVAAFTPLIAAEYEPVMDCLREAMNNGMHSDPCAGYIRPDKCNCWVSRAQKLIEDR